MPPHSFAEWVVGRNLPPTKTQSSRRPVLKVQLTTDDEAQTDTLLVTYPRTGNTARPSIIPPVEKKTVKFEPVAPPKSALKAAPKPTAEQEEVIAVKKGSRSKSKKTRVIVLEESDSDTAVEADSQDEKESAPETSEESDVETTTKLLKPEKKSKKVEEAAKLTKKKDDKKEEPPKEETKDCKKTKEADADNEKTDTSESEQEAPKISKKLKKRIEKEARKSSKKSKKSARHEPEIRRPNLVGPVTAKVVHIEHAIEDAQDPRPNAFMDNENGICRVYHGPMYGNSQGVLYPEEGGQTNRGFQQPQFPGWPQGAPSYMPYMSYFPGGPNPYGMPNPAWFNNQAGAWVPPASYPYNGPPGAPPNQAAPVPSQQVSSAPEQPAPVASPQGANQKEGHEKSEPVGLSGFPVSFGTREPQGNNGPGDRWEAPVNTNDKAASNNGNAWNNNKPASNNGGEWGFGNNNNNNAASNNGDGWNMTGGNGDTWTPAGANNSSDDKPASNNADPRAPTGAYQNSPDPSANKWSHENIGGDGWGNGFGRLPDTRSPAGGKAGSPAGKDTSDKWKSCKWNSSQHASPPLDSNAVPPGLAKDRWASLGAENHHMPGGWMSPNKGSGEGDAATNTVPTGLYPRWESSGAAQSTNGQRDTKNDY